MIPDFNNMIPELHYYIHRKCTPNWKIDANVIPFIDITYVIDGKAEYNIGGHIYIVKKGDLICIPQNTYRAAVNIPEDLMECYSTNIFLRDQFGQEARLPLPIISHIGIIPRLISRFHEIHEEWLQRDFGYMLKIRGILCLILYQISNLILNENHLSQEDPRIKNSIRYMSMHYQDPLTIDLMARQFHLHPVYYGSLFREAMGLFWNDRYNEVALQCGFSDIFYFSKLFKEKKGIPPSGMFPPERRKKKEDTILLPGGKEE